MVRPLLLTAGSRGDVEPVLALAESPDLDEPVLYVQRDYSHLAPHSQQLPFSMQELTTSLDYAAKCATENDHPFEIMLRAIAHSCVHYILPAADEIIEVARKSDIDVVISASITWSLGQIVAEKVGVPLVMLSFQPSIPSRFVPDVCLMPEKASIAYEKLVKGETLEEKDENMDGFVRIRKVINAVALPLLNKHRVRLGLKPLNEEHFAADFSGKNDIPWLIACSPHITPAPPDLHPQNIIVGSLAASFIPKNYNPNEVHSDLCQFLEDGPPPVVVSYGSMGWDIDSAKLTSTVLTGLRDANVKRVVMVSGAAGLDVSLLDQDSELAAWARRVVFTMKGPVQYSYLLPRASLFLCHGGAGSMAAALHAGTPLVITPVFADQPFHAEMVTRLQLGSATPIGLEALEPEILTSAVKSALCEQVVRNVREFAKRESNAIPPVARVASALKDILDGKKAD